jgi:hypothetical protein
LPDGVSAFLDRGGHGDGKVVYVNLGAGWAALPHAAHLPFARAVLAACAAAGRRALVHLPCSRLLCSSQPDEVGRECAQAAARVDLGALLEAAFAAAENQLAQPSEGGSGSSSSSSSSSGSTTASALVWRCGALSPALLLAAKCCGVVHHGGR